MFYVFQKREKKGEGLGKVKQKFFCSDEKGQQAFTGHPMSKNTRTLEHLVILY